MRIRPYRLSAPYMPGDSFSTGQAVACADNVHFFVYLGTLGDNDLFVLRQTERARARLYHVTEIDLEILRRQSL